MQIWKKIDLENWPRREHYQYYTQNLKVEFNMTANIRVENLLEFCHRRGLKFYPVFIWLTARVVNGIENFRMFRDKEGSLCVWDYVNPSYTIFHEDDKTFSDCWSYYVSDFSLFYQSITEDMKKYGDRKGIKARKNQPQNFYCVSCAPWTSFTGYSTRAVGGEPQYFPIIAGGKYERVGEGIQMPVSITIAHAVCDGYHAGLFFESLQREIDNLRG